MKSSIGVVALAACAWATSARADDAPLSLTWIAPPACSTQADVEADVTRRLAGSVSAKPVLARAEVTQRKDSWRVVLTTWQAGAEGHRVLEGPSCAAVAAATALILALTIDPQAAAQNSSASPTPLHASPAPAPVADSPPPPPPPAPSAATPASVSASFLPALQPRWEWLLRAALTAGVGVDADPFNAGLSFAVGGGVGPLTLELTATSFLPTSHDVRPGVGGTFWPLAIGTWTCAALLDGKIVGAGACAGVELQHVQATGHGVSHPGSGASDRAALGAAPFVHVKLTSSLWLVGRIDVTFPSQQDTFVLADIGAVYRVSPATLRASAGVEVRF